MQVTMSYLEIYNENIRDLLDPSSGYLELRDESGGKNIQVSSAKIFRYLAREAAQLMSEVSANNFQANKLKYF